MDINTILDNINNLDKYARISQDLETNSENYTVSFNASTILCLKKLGNLEIEYFRKYGKRGATMKIFEIISHMRPSKTWKIMAQSVIKLEKYWLSFVRQLTVTENWWPYLHKMLQFLKVIKSECQLTDYLVEETADLLLSLVIHDIPNISQKHEILCILNFCCKDCSRDFRIHLRTKLECFFIKLAELLATCGDVGFQYNILATLIKWLLPRQDNKLRQEAAAKWFPDRLYKRDVVKLFLERRWSEFLQDARDFLNVHNKWNGLVASVIITRFKIGDITLIPGPDVEENWLDVNTDTKCLSLILKAREAKLLGCCDVDRWSFGILLINEVNTVEVRLKRQSYEAVLSVRMFEAPNILAPLATPASISNNRVEITISSKTEFDRTVNLLREIFADKFQEGDPSLLHSQPKTGYKVISNNIRPNNLNSSLTSASSTSIGELQKILTVSPRVDYGNKPKRICATPALSNVTELTEVEEQSSFSTNANNTRKDTSLCSVSYKSSLCNNEIKETNERREKTGHTKYVSPGIDGNEPISCLLVATVGTTDESIINNKIKQLSKNKVFTIDNLVKVLEQEENESREKANVPSVGDKTITVNQTNMKKENIGIKSTVISAPTSFEQFGDDIIENTPIYVNTKKRGNKCSAKNETNKPLGADSSRKSYDEKVMENFFSEHFSESPNGELIINPPLQKTISESSSRSTNDFEEVGFNKNMDEDVAPNVEVVDSLRPTGDNNCDKSEQNDKNLNQNLESIYLEKNIVAEKTNGDDRELPVQVQGSNTKSAEHVTLRFKATQQSARRKGILKKTLKEDSTKTPAIWKNTKETNSKDKVADTVKRAKQKASEENAPNVRKRRKLYSPKTQHFGHDEDVVPGDDRVATTESNITTNNEVQKGRDDYKKKLRNRKLILQADSRSPSPKTKERNNLFDQMKAQTNYEKVIVMDVNKTVDIYHFNVDSDSEIESNKENSSRLPAKRKRTKTSDKKKREIKQYCPITRISTSNINRTEEPVRTTVDERMRSRETREDDLNTSLQAEKPPPAEIKDSSPNLKTCHKMEVMKEDPNKSTKNVPKSNASTKKCVSKNKLPLKGNTQLEILESSLINDASGNRSPLPGLLVEKEIPQEVNTAEDDTEQIALNKLERLVQNGFELSTSNVNTTTAMLSDISDDFIRRSINSAATSSRQSPHQKISPINKASENAEKTVESPNNNRNLENNFEILNVSSHTMNDEDRSMKTGSCSSIAAHRALDICNDDLPLSQNQNTESPDLECDDILKLVKQYCIDADKDPVHSKSPVLPCTRIISTDDNKQLDTNSAAQVKQISLTHISPVKLFEELQPATRMNSNSSKSSDDAMNRTFFHETQSTEIESKNRSHNYSLRSRRKELCEESAVTILTKKPPVKRKLIDKPSQDDKKSKPESDESRTMSAFSVSGIDLNGWFNSMKPASSKEVTHNVGYKENLSCIMERLDTTLNKLHENTAMKRLPDIFSGAESELDALNQKRTELFKTTAREMFNDIAQIINSRLADVYTKSEEMNRSFMTELKKKTKEAIMNDCKERKSVVLLLRRDMQAVVDFINKDK